MQLRPKWSFISFFVSGKSKNCRTKTLTDLRGKMASNRFSPQGHDDELKVLTK